MEACKDVELLRDRLRSLKEPYIKAVIMFGSRAREESRGRSDVDLLFFMKAARLKIQLRGGAVYTTFYGKPLGKTSRI